MIWFRRLLLCNNRSGERRIIRVALVLAGIERFLIRRVERGLLPVALRQIGIGEERHSEGDEIGFGMVDRGICCLGIKAAIDDVGALEDILQDRRNSLGAIGGGI